MPNKAIAAGSGGGVAGAVVTLGLALWGHDLSPEAAAALTTLVAALLAALSAYYTPHEG